MPALARAYLRGPALILLDEVSTGLESSGCTSEVVVVGAPQADVDQRTAGDVGTKAGDHGA